MIRLDTLRPFVRKQQMRNAELQNREVRRMAQTQIADQLQWFMAGVQFGQGLGQQRGGQNANLAYGGSLPGIMPLTQQRRRRRPRKSTTGTGTSTTTRSHKRKTS
jgi:hypothetical protein